MSDVLFVCLQPVDGIERDPALPADLEMKVWTPVARLTADVAEGLPFDHALPLRHRGVAQVSVERVVAAPVVQQDRREIRAEWAGEADGTARDRPHRRPRRCGDADAVPRDAGVYRTGGVAELVHDLALHRPLELAQVCGGNRGRRRDGAARLGLAPGALERHDAVVQALFVALELGESLRRLARAAARLAQRGLARVLEGEIALQLVRALVLAAAQGVARVHQRLALARDPTLQLEHVVGEQAILTADEIEILVA